MGRSRAGRAGRSATAGPGASGAVAAVLLLGTLGAAAGPGAQGLAQLPPEVEDLLLQGLCPKLGLYTAVWEVQGDGDASPKEGEVPEDVEGVVTADFQRGTGGPWEPWGFYLQAHEPDCDEATSDGIFVYTGRSPQAVAPGDKVRINGAKVVEFRGADPGFVWDAGLTELVCGSGCAVEVLQRGLRLPKPVDLLPPGDLAEAGRYLEAREGMLVGVAANATVVAPTNAYNEALVLRGEARDRLHHDSPDAGEGIWVDGDAVARSRCGADGLPRLRTFDRVVHDPEAGLGIVGPLAYNFNTYKVQQDDAAACIAGAPGDASSYDPAANPPPVADGATFTIATLNAWNYFDTANDPAKADEGSTPSAAEFARRTAKLAAAVCDPAGLARPLVVALQEVEHLAVVQHLAGAVAQRCGAAYQAHAAGAPDDRGIEVAYLTRADAVEVLQARPRQGCAAKDWGVTYEPGDAAPGVACPPGEPFFLHPRPPLELTLRVDLGGAERTLTVLNNHFKSKLPSSRCAQPDCTDWRDAEAAHVRALVDGLLAADPEALVVVVGDLNDAPGTAPLQRLEGPDGPLRNAWLDLQGPPSEGQGSIRRYSHAFQGLGDAIDHVLLSQALADLPRQASPRRLSVDWPADHRADATMFGLSDHDPLLVGIAFGAR